MTKKLFFSAAIFALALTCFISCKKSHDNGTPADANVMVVNASPGDSTAYDFYFNDAKLGASPQNYPSNSGYIFLAPKAYTVKVAAVNTINPIASGSYNLNSNKYYSVFAYDTLLAGKIKVFALEDDLAAPAAGKAKVRFLDLSPFSINVDILANDSVVFANRSYADHVANNAKAAFISVNAGSYTVTIKLAGSGTGIPPLFTLNNVSFADGKIYTIFAKGTVNGTGVNALGAAMIINK